MSKKNSNITTLTEFPKISADLKLADFIFHIENNNKTGVLPFLIGLENCLEESEFNNFLEERSLKAPKKNLTEVLSEEERKIMNKHYQLNVYDIQNERIEYDIDMGSSEFQKKFYMKYITHKEAQVTDEFTKINNLKVRVTLEKGQFVFLNRPQLDILMQRFKKIYASIFKLKHFLTFEASKFFFSIYDFEQFLVVHSSLHQDLVFIEKTRGFELRWKPSASEQIIVFDKDHKPLKYISPREIDCKKTISNYFKNESFDVVKQQPGGEVIEWDELIAVQLRSHMECFEFLIKGERLRDDV